jgi:ech hydrogenase subunit E
MQTWRVREQVMDVIEMTAGNRVIPSTCCIGGVRRDIDPGLASAAMERLSLARTQLKPILDTLLGDYTVRKRSVGKGVLGAETALSLGATGPTLRASGVARDLRNTGYAAYPRLSFEPVTESDGDCYARAKVRTGELLQSFDLVRECLEAMPTGEISVRAKGNPAGEAISRCEQPRGEVFYYLRSNGTPNLERMKIRTPTYANLPPLLSMLPGCEMADVPVIILSIDPCISCTER